LTVSRETALSSRKAVTPSSFVLASDQLANIRFFALECWWLALIILCFCRRWKPKSWLCYLKASLAFMPGLNSILSPCPKPLFLTEHEPLDSHPGLYAWKHDLGGSAFWGRAAAPFKGCRWM